MTLCVVVALAIACDGSPNANADQPTAPESRGQVVVATAYSPQLAVVGNAFGYDATIGGTAFSDPRGTGLTYSIRFEPNANGLTATRGRVLGVPLAPGVTTAEVTATDARGSNASQSLTITVSTNEPVAVISPRGPQVVIAAEPVSIDVADAFSDPRSTGLTFTISFSPPTNGLAASGGRVVGSSRPGITVVSVTAVDATWRSATMSFPIVAFGADLTRPTLPATHFAYSDARVPLPAHFGVRGVAGTAATADNTPATNLTTDAGATLGRVLFYDRRLSANDRVSCGSCHFQEFAFADTARLSRGFAGELTARHSPSLANGRFYQRGRFFRDERAPTLEALALQPIQSTVEMGMTLDNLLLKLSLTDYYGDLFLAAFGSRDITTNRVALALSQFVRSLASANSRFDQAFAGGTVANFATTFTPQESQGRQLFSGRGCASCHATNAHIGVNVQNTGLDSTVTDVGAGLGRFKTPSLRNVAVRAPYMHDGRFATLESVVEFYSNEVQNGANLDQGLRQPGNGPALRNRFTTQEKAALVAFLRTLTDQTFLSDIRFADPFVR